MTDIAMTVPSLITRSAFYGAFARLFHFPGEDGEERLRETVESLDGSLAGLEGTELLAQFRTALAGENGHAFEHQFNRLLAGSPACRLNETDYERLSFSMTERIADVNGFYEAFGYEVDVRSGERPDFIGTECEFAQLLLLKAAYAIEEGWQESTQITEDAYRDFLKEHLLHWVPLFTEQLEKVTEGEGVFGAAAPLLRAFIQAEGDRLGLEGAPLR